MSSFFTRRLRALSLSPWSTGPILVGLSVTFSLVGATIAVTDGVLFRSFGAFDEGSLHALTATVHPTSEVRQLNSDDLVQWRTTYPDTPVTAFRVQPVQVDGALVGRAAVQENFFDVLGVKPIYGGLDFATVPAVLESRVVSDFFFRSRLGSDAAALDQTVVVDPATGYGYRFSGLLPRSFVFPSGRWRVDLLAAYRSQSGVQEVFSQAIVRLPPHRDQLTKLEYTSGNEVRRLSLVPLRKALSAATGWDLWLLLAAAGLLVVVATLGTSSLLAAKATDRAHDVRIQLDLGGSRTRVVIPIVVEALLLCLGAAAVGLLGTRVLLIRVSHLIPDDLALLRYPEVDIRIGVWLAGVALLMAIVAPVWPALMSLRAATLIRTHGRQLLLSGGGALGRSMVVAGHVGVALAIGIPGALLVGSVIELYRQTPPISTERTSVVSVAFQGTNGRGLSTDRNQRAESLVARILQEPAVESAAVTAYDLLDRAYVPSLFDPPSTATDLGKAVMMQAVMGQFYQILKPTLLDGRLPTDDEVARNEPLLVVSQLAAEGYWPGQSAVGKSLMDKGLGDEPQRLFTVVGVVKDVPWYSWDEAPLPTIYGPFHLLSRQQQAVLLIKTRGAQLADATVRAVLRDADSWLRVGRYQTLDGLFADSVRPRRFLAWVFGTLAVGCLSVLLLVVLGHVALNTARRKRELGLRAALGATNGQLVWGIVLCELRPIAVGAAAGVVASLWTVSLIAHHLYRIQPFQYSVWFGTTLLVIATAALGSAVPAARIVRSGISAVTRHE